MYPNFSYNVNFGQNMMASMIQAIQASKSSESSLASLRNLRTFLLLIEINMLGTNLETGSHIYPWLWSNQCRWSLTPKLYVQNHQIHQKNGSSKAAVGTTMTPIRLAEAKPDFPAAEKSPR